MRRQCRFIGIEWKSPMLAAMLVDKFLEFTEHLLLTRLFSLGTVFLFGAVYFPDVVYYFTLHPGLLAF